MAAILIVGEDPDSIEQEDHPPGVTAASPSSARRGAGNVAVQGTRG